MVEKFNCKGMYDCDIDCHLVLVKYADYRTLALLLKAAHKELTDHGHQELMECDCAIATAIKENNVS
jgi:hypothetical protein